MFKLLRKSKKKRIEELEARVGKLVDRVNQLEAELKRIK